MSAPLPMVPYEMERAELLARLEAGRIRERAHADAYARLLDYSRRLEQRVNGRSWRAIRLALGLEPSLVERIADRAV